MELRKRIEEVILSNSKENQGKIDSLHQKQQAEKENVDKLTRILNDLSAIETVYENTFNSDFKDMTLAKVVQEISKFKEEENIYNQRKQEYAAFQQTIESLNITEDEFSYLSNKLITDIRVRNLYWRMITRNYLRTSPQSSNCGYDKSNK